MDRALSLLYMCTPLIVFFLNKLMMLDIIISFKDSSKNSMLFDIFREQ
jgi:hypothetical protein